MIRRSFRLLAFLVLVSLCTPALAQSSGGPILSRSIAARNGLNRAWFTQIQLDRARSRVNGIAHHGGMLFVQTDLGMLHAINSETGRTHWAVQVGNRRHPSLPPAANDHYVAVVNGSTLYVLNRETGRSVKSHRLGGGPGAGPALSKDRAYAPLINGRIESIELEEQTRPTWIYSSNGRALLQPVASAENICWPTDKGILYVARTTDPAIRFRVETNDSIEASATYQKPFFYAASRDGYVYAVHERSGKHRWRFSAGDPIGESPAVIEDHVYICPDRAGMYCVSVETGEEVWWTPRVARFLAASKNRIYATDKVNRIFVLDRKSGSRLGTIYAEDLSLYLVNTKTDRVFVGTETGLIQCLHDVAHPDPRDYSSQVEGEAKDPDGAVQQEGIGEKPKPEAADDDPFGGGGKPKPAADDDPFGGGDKPKPAADDDPFGGGDKPKPAADDDPFGGGDKPKPAADDDPFGGGDKPKPAADDDDPFG